MNGNSQKRMVKMGHFGSDFQEWAPVIMYKLQESCIFVVKVPPEVAHLLSVVEVVVRTVSCASYRSCLLP